MFLQPDLTCSSTCEERGFMTATARRSVRFEIEGVSQQGSKGAKSVSQKHYDSRPEEVGLVDMQAIRVRRVLLYIVMPSCQFFVDTLIR
jgi:hypothetical protein